jgi:polyisoprenoid-binding protein YceI
VLAEGAPGEAHVPAGALRYVVDTQAAEIRMLVYRDGPLARFGHNHVIVGRVEGELHAGENAAASAFRLEVPVAGFEVDPPRARADEGADFESQVSDAAREGTRANMLGKDVLDAANHPFVRIESVMLAGPDWNPTVTARVTLRGTTRDFRFPAAVFRQGDTLAVIASFKLSQSAFGITPFAALNGGLLVRDVLDVRIRLVARRAT